MKRIFLDNNMWDYFYRFKIDISHYFPEEKFTLFISKQGRYEIDQAPSSKEEFKQFVYSHLTNTVNEDHIFGFHNDQLPDDEQRISGFGMGRFTSCEENQARDFLYQKFGTNDKRKTKNILFKQEADIELGALSMANNIVISFDSKNGPLKEASKCGGKVIFLNKEKSEETSVDKFINDLLSQISKI